MRKWLDDRLRDLKPAKSKIGLARALGLQAARVTEMIAGTRSIKAEEIGPMAGYLEWQPDRIRQLIDGTADLPPQSTEKINPELTNKDESLTPGSEEDAQMYSEKVLELLEGVLELPPEWQERACNLIRRTVGERQSSRASGPPRRARRS